MQRAKKLAYKFLENAKNDITNTDLLYFEKALFNFLKSRFDFQTTEFSKKIKLKLSKEHS